MPRLALSFIFALLCLSPLTAKKKAEKQPIWLNTPSSIYPEKEYLAEIGSGSSQKEADNKAIEGLASVFNLSISSKTNSSLNYRENTSSVDKTKNIDTQVLILTSIKNLVGVQIKERWKSKEGIFYSLAVLNKQKAILIYSEKVESCMSLIDETLNIPDEEKGTFHEYSRYAFATLKASEMSLYNAYLAVLNPASSLIYEEDYYNADILKVKSATIAKNILIEVRFEGKETRLKHVFENVFTSRGFTIAKNGNGRYVLNAKLELGENTKLSDDRLMVRYSLTSELLDSITKESYLPFVINSKAVHFDNDGLKNQIFKDLQKKIEKDFDSLFTKYIENSTAR